MSNKKPKWIVFEVSDGDDCGIKGDILMTHDELTSIVNDHVQPLPENAAEAYEAIKNYCKSRGERGRYRVLLDPMQIVMASIVEDKPVCVGFDEDPVE